MSVFTVASIASFAARKKLRAHVVRKIPETSIRICAEVLAVKFIGDGSICMSLHRLIYVINVMCKAPPLLRGGGSVCRDGGVFAVI